MTIDQIKDAIRIDVTPDVRAFHDRLTATLTLSTVLFVSRYEECPRFDILDMAKRNAKDLIVRQMFEDQRRALMDAIVALQMVNPIDYAAFKLACDKVLEVASFQKPAFAHED